MPAAVVLTSYLLKDRQKYENEKRSSFVNTAEESFTMSSTNLKRSKRRPREPENSQMAKLNKIRCTGVGYLAHLFFTFAILLIVDTPGSAQSGIENRIPEKLLRAYSALIDFNIQETKNQLALFSRTKKAHPFQWYIASMEASAQLLSTGDKNDFLQKNTSKIFILNTPVNSVRMILTGHFLSVKLRCNGHWLN